jgi:hypothetical protein
VEPSGPDTFATILEPTVQLTTTLAPSSSVLPTLCPTSSDPDATSLVPSTAAPALPVFSLAPCLPFPPSAAGGAVAILADGDCCYHLCALIGDLMLNPAAVQCGFTTCLPAATLAARARIMDNINEYIDFVKSTCVDESEVEGAIMENHGELPSSFVPRVMGLAKGDNRLGLINDFAAYTAKTPFQVMVVDADRIRADSSPEELQRAVRKAELPTDTEFVKCRLVCAVLHKKHYDLGVVRSAGLVHAVFAAGKEWEAALELILAFVRSRAPARGQARGELCPRWVPPVFVPVSAHTPSKSTRTLEGERVSKREDTSPSPSSLSSLQSVSVLSVFSPVLAGSVKKYTSQSAGVPKHHSLTHQTGL